MKQGNGTDVLGLNDPRNASIGVIYVSPNDEKKSVLAAILTQEKLGRKQVAVVLPDQNKAFQRPGDFDDLKSLRGKLQTQIVFIAAGGPGPAAFARQRNFQVYSTLEIFAKALKDEKQQPENKKGWFSFSGKHKAVTPPVEVPATPAVIAAGSFIAPLSGEEEPVSHNDHVVPLVLGGAVAVPATPTPLATNSQSTPLQEQDAPPATSAYATIADDEDWHALAPIAGGAAASVVARNGNGTSGSAGNGGHENHAANSTNGANGSGDQSAQGEEEPVGGPGIILLSSTRNKATVKLPIARDSAYVPLVVPTAKPEAAPRNGRARTSGKVAAVVAGGVVGGVAAASLARTAGVGNAPPPRTSAGGGGGAGRPRRRGLWLIGLALLLVFTTVVFAGIAISAPSALGPLKAIVPKFTSHATVSIVPDTKTENNNYLISGVASNPNPKNREVSTRVITSSATQSKTVDATGKQQTPAIAATGTILFQNSSPSAQRIASTVFTLSSGVKVTNDATLIPGETNPPTAGFIIVNARAVTLGSAGNIGGRVFYGSCCAANISAYINAFSGGQDAQDYTVVSQGDIDGVYAALRPALVTQANGKLQPQVAANEQIAGSPNCTTSVVSSQNAGAKATSVAVTVTATCSEEVYDHKGTLALVTDLLKAKAANDYGGDYALVGNIITQAQVQSVNKDKNIVSLLVSAKGLWAYQFTTERIAVLKKLIVGKNAADAVTTLKGQRGIANASIDPSTGTLPTNLDDITFQIQPVTGLAGGGGTSGGTNPNPTVTGPGTKPTTQPGLGVGGS